MDESEEYDFQMGGDALVDEVNDFREEEEVPEDEFKYNGEEEKENSDIDEEEDTKEVLIAKGKKIVTGAERLSFPVMTRFEKSRLIESLTLMLGDPNFFVPDDICNGLIRDEDIAEYWLDNRKIYPYPILVYRPSPNGAEIYEEWKPEELIYSGNVNYEEHVSKFKYPTDNTN